MKLYVKPNKSLRENAVLSLPSMYDRFMSHKVRVLNHPRLKDQLHRMRLTGKPLRYAMEIFETTFNKGYGKSFEQVKDLIESMGRVHDRDIMISQLVDFMQEIQLYNRTCTSREAKFSLSGLHRLIRQQREQRASELSFTAWEC